MVQNMLWDREVNMIDLSQACLFLIFEVLRALNVKIVTPFIHKTMPSLWINGNYLQGVTCQKTRNFLILHKARKSAETWYSKTNVMHFLFSLLRIKGFYMVQALLAHLQEAIHKLHLVYCKRVMSVGCRRIGMVQPTDITRTQYTKCIFKEPPEDEQVMLETCRGL
jgi:hypothetical protein